MARRSIELLVLILVGLLAGCSDGADIYDFDGDGAPDDQDCAPEDPSIHLGAPDDASNGVDNNCDGVPGVDGDVDGFASVTSGGSDCRDDDPSVNPEATEIPDNDTDEDCDGEVVFCDADGDLVFSDHPLCGGTDCDPTNGLCATAADCLDADGDGYRACDADCLDSDPARFPGNPEVCDGLDNDCDAALPLDEQDVDADGVAACEGDCDDGDAARFPGAEEACTGLDEDCDGSLGADEVDGDTDGFLACAECDDADPLSFPGATEIPYDAIDQDCLNGDLTDVDEDGDDALAAGGTDCDDGNDAILPGAPDPPFDGVDSNCDGADGVDGDGDGWPWLDAPGEAWQTLLLDCDDTDPTLNLDDLDGDGWSTCADDCDDTDAVANIDDADGDGVTSCDGDCDDAEPARSPLLSETCDGLDNDCDGVVPADEVDGDADGWFTCSGDCDDNVGTTWPGAPELCNGVDDDCDAVVPADEIDTDGDFWVACLAWSGGSATVLGGGDCGEGDAGVNPGVMVDGCDDVDSDCNGTIDDTFDSDGDGYCLADCDDTDPLVFSGNWGDMIGDGIDGSCDDGEDWYSLSAAQTSFTVPTDASGQVVSPGDVTGDGVPEVVVAAPGVSGGRVYVYGGAQVAAGGALVVADRLTTLLAVGNDRAGSAVAGGADFDGDGIPDLVVGAENNAEGGAYAGKTYIVSGAAIALGGDVPLASSWASLVGEEAYNFSGGSVAAGGDVDGDGLPDLVVGANWKNITSVEEGRTYVVFGASLAGGGPMALAAADVMLDGTDYGDRSGTAVAFAGDVDGDGYDDVLVGAPKAMASAANDGEVYLHRGIDLAAGGNFANAAAWITFVGEASDDWLGDDVSSAGDIDGDGLDDILLGARNNDQGASNGGKAYLFFGASLTAGGVLSASLADATVVGETDWARCGYSVAAAGDVDGDGLGDVLIACPEDDLGGGIASGPSDGAGRVLVFLGSTLAAGGSFTASDADGHLVGAQVDDGVGYSVATAGDVDGDGRDDVLISANRQNGVQAYLVLSPYP